MRGSSRVPYPRNGVPLPSAAPFLGLFGKLVVGSFGFLVLLCVVTSFPVLSGLAALLLGKAFLEHRRASEPKPPYWKAVVNVGMRVLRAIYRPFRYRLIGLSRWVYSRLAEARNSGRGPNRFARSDALDEKPILSKLSLVIGSTEAEAFHAEGKRDYETLLINENGSFPEFSFTRCSREAEKEANKPLENPELPPNLGTVEDLIRVAENAISPAPKAKRTKIPRGRKSEFRGS